MCPSPTTSERKSSLLLPEGQYLRLHTRSTGLPDAPCRLRKLGYVVLGVSRDSVKKHCNFRDKNELNFPLLSDADEVVVNLYGVLKEKSMYGKKYMGIERSTFIIDEKEIS